MSKYIIDIQGFNGDDNSFIIKELTIADLYGDRILHYLVLPPFDISFLTEKEKKYVSWLQKFHHKIQWNDGQLEYNQVFSILREAVRDADILYIKGSERAAFLRRITSKYVIDLDLLDCPRASCLPMPEVANTVSCNYKSHAINTYGTEQNGICSLVQALKFKLWLRNLFESGVDEIDFS